jgi:hypothetical protein
LEHGSLLRLHASERVFAAGPRQLTRMTDKGADMRAVALVLGAVIASFSAGVADATVRITDDMGGSLTEYESRFAGMQRSGEKVVIDGPCYSACTMLLGMFSRDHVCVTPKAVLGFHAAWDFDDDGHRVTDASATRALMDIYPAPIRSWLVRRGGLSPQIKLLRGQKLASMYPLCR